MESRLTEVEIKLSYLEKNQTDLDEVVRTLFEEVRRLQTEILTLRDQVHPDEKTNLEAEKPPHY